MTHKSVANVDVPLFSPTDLECDGMRVGLNFKDEESGMNAILGWAEKTFCPLVKARRMKDLSQTGGQSCGRRYFECSHGRKKFANYKPKGDRPKQNINFTKV